MKHGANINAQDGFGVTSLMAALFGFKHFFKHENVDQDCLEFLKDERVDISLKTKYLGQTLLHLAACIGSEALGEVVTSHALCDINSRDANGFTPLHYAVMFDNYHMIPLLIKKGADCNAQTTSLRLTPAMMFLVMTSSDSPYKQYLENYNVLMFASRSKEKNAYPKRYEAPWNVVGDLKKLHRSNDDRRRSLVPRSGSSCTLWYLIDKSDCKATDVLGNTVLHFLLPYSNFNGRDIMDNVSRYRQHESLFQTMWGKRNYFHNSPFSLLCRHLTESTFNRSTTSMLHDIAKNIGGDLNEPDSRGITSLHYILKMPLSVHEKTPFFDIPGVDMVGDIRVLSNFLSAVLDQQKSASVVSYGVLERLVQANINSVNAYGLTTLMHLVVKCSSDTSKEFWRVTGSVISSGKANINAQDEKGNTALHFACMFYHNGMLESIFGNLGNQLESASFFLLPFKLLDAGADPTIKNNDGETPLVYAPPLMDHYEGLYKEWLRDYSMKKIL
jgi:ankyrin repeat protein